jgi:hypothetical protein
MQDRSPPVRRNPLATHGRTIHWVNRVGGNHGRPTLSVRSTPNSERNFKGLASVAKCHKQTYAGGDGPFVCQPPGPSLMM